MSHQKKTSITEKQLRNMDKSAAASLLDELFQDMYDQRLHIYKMNFIRGLMLGFGSALGATLLVALLAWILSLFHEVPFVGHIIDSIRQSVEAGRSH